MESPNHPPTRSWRGGNKATICKLDGLSGAGTLKIFKAPCLPIGRSRKLRDFLAQAIVGLPTEDHVPVGRDKHAEVGSSPSGAHFRESTDNRNKTHAKTDATWVAWIFDRC